MNKKEQIKKKSEQGWANILLWHLNSDGFDYKVGNYVTPANEADVDVYAYSNSGRLKSLYLQLCLDVEPKNAGYEKILNTSKSYTFNNFGNTLEAIKAKRDKYVRQRKNFSHITIVVQTYWLEDDDKRYKIPSLTKKCSGFGFKNIYIVAPKGEVWGEASNPEITPGRVFKIC